ncbi:MAG TPA: OmpA family protein [Polyangiaceae bacterium]|jgi:peptidoglycan-associated lipoprotein|nr:OmpA family protein [Polyangiaceae bacterium]
MRIFALTLLPLLVACGSDAKPPPQAPAGGTEPQAQAPAPAPADNPKPDDNPSKSQIRIAEEIKKACGITDDEAHFAYDSDQVRDQDKAVLKKLADCFTTGPLKGRQMKLVGHADPRGEDEYNMVLGGRRADNIKSAIVTAGMNGAKVDSTSRGEMDASGTDDAGWAQDRRVDIMLGQ